MKEDDKREEIKSILLEYEPSHPKYQELFQMAHRDPTLLQAIEDIQQEMDQEFRKKMPNFKIKPSSMPIKSLVLEGAKRGKPTFDSLSHTHPAPKNTQRKALKIAFLAVGASLFCFIFLKIGLDRGSQENKLKGNDKIFFCSHLLGARGAYPANPVPPGHIPGFRLMRISKQKCSCQKEDFTLYEYRHLATGMIFSYIPGGVFTMGSQKGKISSPSHGVYLKPFLISQQEVNRKVWKKIMGSEPWKEEPYDGQGDLLPANYVSWEDASLFCKKTGLRLPTEAEWEFSAMGYLQTNYYWGNQMDDRFCWYERNRLAKGFWGPKEVGQKEANFFHLYDILGNLAEWCADSWKEGGKERKEYAVVRGGSWKDASVALKGKFRNYALKKRRFSYIGFRLAYSLSFSGKKNR